MWIFNNKEFTIEKRGDSIAFVYLITNIITNRKYIGKKLFYSHKYRQINKKRKKIQIESDWQDYWSSCEELKKDVELLGKENFKREILYLCKNKGTASYLEAREQFDKRVLENYELWYNGIINCRVNRKHIKLHNG